MDLVKPLVDYGEQRHGWIAANQRAAHALWSCIERGDCGENQMKVVILVSNEFPMSLMKDKYIGGEMIWAMSTIRALENMGHTVLYAVDVPAAVQLYHLFDPLVKILIMNGEQIQECCGIDYCLKSEHNPAGIPIWKMFAFSFWVNPATDLGNQWTLSPEDYGTNTFLGYSIEAQCELRPFVPHAKRAKQIYIIAKYVTFFDQEKTAWPTDFFEAAAAEVGVEFVTGTHVGDRPDLFPASKHVHNLGSVLTQSDFYGNLSHSVALLGVGDPVTSPTPYDALCLGVPFINPVQMWDPTNPDDRTRWSTQHDPLKELDPPFVYHVKRRDRAAFVAAVRGAVENPISSHVLNRMRMRSVEKRLEDIINRDWRKEAEAILERRRSGAEAGYLFTL
uniref:Alpha-1,6-mannosyl-glycoprotein 6-beta-N-acetylglucosaminyltransferase n=1 Tax=Mycena chlorophos TaxID=658473 RepID=A0ABQ0KZE1_MYCCL|nr:predicted protein [Mycena chlorophos]